MDPFRNFLIEQYNRNINNPFGEYILGELEWYDASPMAPKYYGEEAIGPSLRQPPYMSYPEEYYSTIPSQRKESEHSRLTDEVTAIPEYMPNPQKTWDEDIYREPQKPWYYEGI